MLKNKDHHTFHIPVMGTGFTIDTPLKVARFGIDSVVSIIDHRLIELVREYSCNKWHRTYEPIQENTPDSRARIITAYLNLLDEVVSEQFENLRKKSFSPGTEITRYFELLPESSPLKKDYLTMLKLKNGERRMREDDLRKRMKPGSIDVNVMTKVDKANFTSSNKPLPIIYNDAHAAIRGYAMSELNSSLVLSAGLNPRLYSYIAEFPDFREDGNGRFKKRLIVKVSDYRSALIQGKFLAKKGLWVSEFRIESGLNCGGHAFASEGHLLGPIMHEFNERHDDLQKTLFEIYFQTNQSINRRISSSAPAIHYSVQGGVGSAEEHQLLHDLYGVRSVGWGSPFLLVPEAVNIDQESLKVLCKSDEDDFYLSNGSPLGVRFNMVSGISSEKERMDRVLSHKSGYPCHKRYLVSNNEFTSKPVCVASRQYQRKKIAELETTVKDSEALKKAVARVVEKTCLCVGLGNGVMKNIGVKMYKDMNGVVVCPGPNLAYFTREVSLHEMVDHIYGRRNLIEEKNRPHMFLKELKMYIDYLLERISESCGVISQKQSAYFISFRNNITKCIDYYHQILCSMPSRFGGSAERMINEMSVLRTRLQIALEPTV